MDKTIWERNKDTAYIIGALLGDGVLYHRSHHIVKGRNYPEKCFILKTVDKDFVDKVAGIIKRKGRIANVRKEKMPKCKQGFIWGVYVWGTLVKFLEKETNSKKEIPSWIKNGIDEVRIEFLNGIFDAEGCVGKSKSPRNLTGYRYVVIFTNGDKWADNAMEIAKSVGLQVNGKYRLKNKNLTRPCYHWNINVVSFAKSPLKFSIRRKQKRIEEFKKLRGL